MRLSMNMMTVSCLLSSGRLLDRDVCLSIRETGLIQFKLSERGRKGIFKG